MQKRFDQGGDRRRVSRRRQENKPGRATCPIEDMAGRRLPWFGGGGKKERRRCGGPFERKEQTFNGQKERGETGHRSGDPVRRQTRVAPGPENKFLVKQGEPHQMASASHSRSSRRGTKEPPGGRDVGNGGEEAAIGGRGRRPGGHGLSGSLSKASISVTGVGKARRSSGGSFRPSMKRLKTGLAVEGKGARARLPKPFEVGESPALRPGGCRIRRGNTKHREEYPSGRKRRAYPAEEEEELGDLQARRDSGRLPLQRKANGRKGTRAFDEKKESQEKKKGGGKGKRDDSIKLAGGAVPPGEGAGKGRGSRRGGVPEQGARSAARGAGSLGGAKSANRKVFGAAKGREVRLGGRHAASEWRRILVGGTAFM